MLTAFLDDPTGYGRVVRDEHGKVSDIVEQQGCNGRSETDSRMEPVDYAFKSSFMVVSRFGATYQCPGRVLSYRHHWNSKGQDQPVEAIAADCSDDVLGVN